MMVLPSESFQLLRLTKASPWHDVHLKCGSDAPIVVGGWPRWQLVMAGEVIETVCHLGGSVRGEVEAAVTGAGEVEAEEIGAGEVEEIEGAL